MSRNVLATSVRMPSFERTDPSFRANSRTCRPNEENHTLDVFLQLREGKAPVDDGDRRPESVASMQTNWTCIGDRNAIKIECETNTSRSKTNFPPYRTKVALYKTKLCNKYQVNRYCPHGHKCTFAHGEHELRSRR